MNIMNKKRIFIIAVIIALSGTLATAWMFWEYRVQPEASPLSIATSTQSLVPQISTPTVATSTISKFKTYRNEEWGFEFQYPEDWSIKEKAFVNYYSKFNLEVRPPIRWSQFDSIVINIVLPVFADRAFLGLNPATSTTVVTGIQGIKYEYIFEGAPEVDIVLPFKQNKIIIGTKKKYEESFNQILTSFKFLK
jgi:hypothetical protein